MARRRIQKDGMYVSPYADADNTPAPVPPSVTTAHCQISTLPKPTDPPKNISVNNVYFIKNSGSFASGDYATLGAAVAQLFNGSVVAGQPGGTFTIYKFMGPQTVKVYELQDPIPRVPRWQATTYDATSSSLGPRQVALCLSFYGTNPQLKRQRGRIYIGPIPQSWIAEIPSAANMNEVLDCGKGLNAISALGYVHVVYSRVSGQTTPVHHYWVNDVWDTIRERLQPEGSRVTASF